MRRSRVTVPTTLLSCIAAAAVVSAQTPFESGVDLVAVDVCATDRAGHPVAMTANDLAVFDNGTPQRVVLFSEGDEVPLAVTLLVDSSQSMHRGLLERARTAASALIEQLPADSLVEVIAFNDHPAIRYPLGADHQRAESALAELSPAGATALYEAVLVAIRDQERASLRRRERYREVIVLLTDGENTSGPLDFDEVIDDVRRSAIRSRSARWRKTSSSGRGWGITRRVPDGVRTYEPLLVRATCSAIAIPKSTSPAPSDSVPA